LTTPLLGFCAYSSGSGKTTLLTALIPLLNEAGLRVSVIKHTHHPFEIDQPGKDSYRLRKSGAVQMLLSSNERLALMTERIHLEKDTEPDLQELLQHMDTSLADLIVVEGFKHAPIPKIEIYRPSLGNPLLAERDAHIIAIAADGEVKTHLPVLDLNNPVNISAFVHAWLKDR
jgi:molybdopterin-guanine dinucleotide biosynthesis protein B